VSRFGIVKIVAISAASSLMLASPHSYGALRCELVFLNAKHFSPESIEEQIVHLANLRIHLDTSMVIGLQSATIKRLKLDYFHKELELLEYLKLYTLMDERTFKEKIRNAISRLQEGAKVEEVIKEQVRAIEQYIITPENLARKIALHKVPAGTFFPHPSTEIKIEHAFEMMDTTLTQFTWARLNYFLGERDKTLLMPSAYRRGPYSEKLKIGDMIVDMQPDLPVTNLGWSQVQSFLARLNEVSREGDSADQKMLATLLPGHREGDVYALPTKEQMSYVMTNLGADLNDALSLRMQNIDEFAWINTNSQGHPHPVATKKPRLVGGQKFYDLEGNVLQAMALDSAFRGPFTKGGSFRDGASLAQPWSMAEFQDGSARTGVRLVRIR